MNYPKELLSAIQNGEIRFKDEQGRTAVLYSPEYGSGWSTWICFKGGITKEFACMDSQLVQMALRRASEEEVSDYISLIFPNSDPYMGSNWVDIQVKYIDPGSKFLIREHDGAEYFQMFEEVEWLTTT